VGSYGVHYISVSLLGAGLLTLWTLVSGFSIRDLSARAICSLSGHLRARPDPWMESALRKAFTEFDRELAVILRDRSTPLRAPASAHPAHSHDPRFPAGQSDTD
jgi:hypothetical protein